MQKYNTLPFLYYYRKSLYPIHLDIFHIITQLAQMEENKNIMDSFPNTTYFSNPNRNDNQKESIKKNMLSKHSSFLRYCRAVYSNICFYNLNFAISLGPQCLARILTVLHLQYQPILQG